MRKNLGVKSYLLPLPVLIIGTYNEDDTVDAMNAAWGTLCETNKVALFLSAEHKTFKNIVTRKAFTVSLADIEHVTACDYVGIVSANDDPNKFIKSGFHASKSSFVDAPVIEELPLTLECKLDMIDEKLECVIGEIINVSLDDRVLINGKIDFSKLNLISYNPIDHTYVQVKNTVAHAFHEGLKLK